MNEDIDRSKIPMQQGRAPNEAERRLNALFDELDRKQFEFFGLYEIVPGFVLSLIAIYIVSLKTAPPDEELVKVFEETEKELVESRD